MVNIAKSYAVIVESDTRGIFYLRCSQCGEMLVLTKEGVQECAKCGPFGEEHATYQHALP